MCLESEEKIGRCEIFEKLNQKWSFDFRHSSPLQGGAYEWQMVSRKTLTSPSSPLALLLPLPSPSPPPTTLSPMQQVPSIEKLNNENFQKKSHLLHTNSPKAFNLQYPSKFFYRNRSKSAKRNLNFDSPSKRSVLTDLTNSFKLQDFQSKRILYKSKINSNNDKRMTTIKVKKITGQLPFCYPIEIYTESSIIYNYLIQYTFYY